MNQAQLIAAMIDAAAPVIKAYWTDLAHDARLIEAAEPGSAFLWAPRECGTSIVLLKRADRPNIRAAEIFSAMTQTGAGQWHVIQIEPFAKCTIEPAAADTACAIAWSAKREAEATENRVSELHM